MAVDPARYAALFATESREHIQHCNTHLLAWERSPAAPEPLQGLFRSVHTLKGMAAAMGFGRLADLAHAFENLLSSARDGSAAPTPSLIELSFEVVDQLEQGCALAIAGREDGFDVTSLVDRIAARDRSEAPAPAPVAEKTAVPPAGDGAGLGIRVKLAPGVAMPAARAIVVLRRALSLGAVEGVTPPVDDWMNERFDGAFGFWLRGDSSPEDVRSALLAVGDVVEVSVGEAPPPGGPREVRVDQTRLDGLLALTGELVVARNRLAAVAERRRDLELEDVTDRVSRLVSEVQAQVLRTRMAPVAEVLERFPRAVRDLARSLEKQVRFEVLGGEIELDRAILAELADPLLHLVRNAVDHGIEPPPERVERAKPPEGMVRVRARRERNHVMIEIEDDGRGVDREEVLARARREGWLAPEVEAGEDQLLAILARPGFSTAIQVSDVSGRGVGIDAVTHWVRSLGGTTSLHSLSGRGTTVTLRLPLTVAIVPALLVGVAERRYAVPLGYVAETTRLREGATERGEPVPVIDLDPAETDRTGAGGWRPAVILDVAGRRRALPVDTLLGHEDIVIGPVTAPAGTPSWISGATILADGRPALVIDPGALITG